MSVHISLVITVTDGDREVTVPVPDDKRAGGMQRMWLQAIKAAQGQFPRGVTIWVKNNWRR